MEMEIKVSEEAIKDIIKQHVKARVLFSTEYEGMVMTVSLMAYGGATIYLNKPNPEPVPEKEKENG